VNEYIQTTLFAAPREAYPGKYDADLLEQYKIYVASAEKVSDRRHTGNAFFLAINTALVSLIGFRWPEGDKHLAPTWVMAIALSGIVLSVAWRLIVGSYRGLNSGKFAVIHAIEERLPLRLFACEWEALGGGKDRRKYTPLSHVEQTVPLVFLLLYLMMALWWALRSMGIAQ